MFKELIRPHQRPVTNVAAIIVMMITFGPILLAYYWTRDTQDVAGSGK
jgi:putative spermidine/putrescine transport system permease protein